MQKSFLFLVCLCVCMILNSQQAFASLTAMSNLSSFDQSGNFYVDSTGGYFTSTNWNAGTSGSWCFEGHAVNMTQNGSSFDITFGTGALTFKNGSTSIDTYTSSMTGSGTLAFGYTSYWNGTQWAWTFNPSLSPIDITGSGPINLNNIFTGFTVNVDQMSGFIGYNNSSPGNPNFGGTINSLSGSITGSPVPIPAALWLLGSGLIGLVGIRRKLDARM